MILQGLGDYMQSVIKWLVNIFLFAMILILLFAIIAYIWSIYDHQQNLYYRSEATGELIRRTGMDSMDLRSPGIGYFNAFVIFPVTIAAFFIRRAVYKRGQER